MRQEFGEIDISTIHFHPENPRQGDVGAVSESIERNGFYGAIVVQESTRRILVGNHRVKAASALGMTTVPGVMIDVDDAVARRILLADNRTSDLASYDDAALVAILAELAASGDLPGTGWDGEALDTLIRDVNGDAAGGSFGGEDQSICPQCGRSLSAP